MFQELNPAELTAILSNALEMKQFERGMPRVICGMSGDELAREIIAHAGLSPVECRGTYPFDRSPQYWAGWVLAYAQWMCSLCFSDLLEVAPLDWIIGSYHPLHEASEDNCAIEDLVWQPIALEYDSKPCSSKESILGILLFNFPLSTYLRGTIIRIRDRL